MNLSGGIVSVDEILDKAWNAKSLLQRVASNEHPLHALIDTGALVTGMTNKEVAEFLLQHLPGHFEGCVFISEAGRKQILVRSSQAVVDLDESPSIPLEHRFVFYDQVHTTGMDIQHKPDAVAALTLGKDMVFRDYSQGAYRMRGVGKGQKIRLVIVPEIRQLMDSKYDPHGGRNAMAPNPNEDGNHIGIPPALRVPQVGAWLMINTALADQLQWASLQMKDAANVWRLPAFRRLLGSDGPISFRDVEEEEIQKSAMTFIDTVIMDVKEELPRARNMVEMLEGAISSAQKAGYLTVPDRACKGSQGDDEKLFKVRKETTGSEMLDGREMLDRIRAQVSKFVEATAFGQALGAEQEKEQEQEQEKEQEQEQEQEMEIEQFVDMLFAVTMKNLFLGFTTPWPKCSTSEF